MATAEVHHKHDVITVKELIDGIDGVDGLKSTKKYFLPSLQREFVWKPFQIERLIDRHTMKNVGEYVDRLRNLKTAPLDDGKVGLLYLYDRITDALNYETEPCCEFVHLDFEDSATAFARARSRSVGRELSALHAK